MIRTMKRQICQSKSIGRLRSLVIDITEVTQAVILEKSPKNNGIPLNSLFKEYGLELNAKCNNIKTIR